VSTLDPEEAAASAGGRHGGSPRLRATWYVAVGAGFLLSFLLWSAASPLMSVPDEPAHVIRAAAVWHGQLGGRSVELPVDPAAPNLRLTATRVEVPRYYAGLGDVPRCYAFRPEVSAACSPGASGGSRPTAAETTAGAYAPVYYALVGWPSRLFASDLGVHLMRATSAVVCAALLAAAVWVLSRLLDPRLALTAVWVAATPMLHFLAGSVNPNGVETAAAVAAWAAALVVFATAADGRVDHRALWTFVVAACVLLPTRTLSPVFLLAAVGTALLLAGPRSVRPLARDRSAWMGAGIVGVVLVASVAWAVRADQLSTVVGSYAPRDEELLVWLAGGIDDWLLQMLAIFGWMDVGPVLVTAGLWLAVVAGLVMVGLLGGRPWRALVLGALVVASLLGPVLIQAPVARDHGIAWQGRYLLPVAVGVPLVAVLVALDGPLRRRLPVGRLGALVLGACAAALVAAHVVTMQRYVTGVGVTQNYLSARGWSPAVGRWPLLVLTVVAACWPLVLLRWRPFHDLGPAATAGADLDLGRDRDAGTDPDADVGGADAAAGAAAG
jgi:hypothetical protein